MLIGNINLLILLILAVVCIFLTYNLKYFINSHIVVYIVVVNFKKYFSIKKLNHVENFIKEF